MGLICRYAGAGTSALRAFCSPPRPREGLVHSCTERGRVGSCRGMLTQCDGGPAAGICGHCAPKPASSLASSVAHGCGVPFCWVAGPCPAVPGLAFSLRASFWVQMGKAVGS